MNTLTTVDEAIEALNGNTRLAARYGLGVSSNSVSNWRSRGLFPARTYVRINGILRRADLVAPFELFTFDPPIKESES